jgi:alpha-beta hydrolase superfamily lysophospholipase
VHAYDQQGHGRSEGPRAHVRRFGDLLDDLGALLALVRAEHAGLPLFLLGHSMGGLVVTAFLRERAPDVSGAVTTGAALAVSERLSAARIASARLLAWIAPRLSFDAGLDPEGISRDPEVVRAYREDPLVGRRITAALASELHAALRRTAAGAADVRVPVLLLHGEEDPLCPVRGSADFQARLRVPSQLRTYPRLRHEILNEPERAAVLEDAFEWIRRLPARPAELAP